MHFGLAQNMRFAVREWSARICGSWHIMLQHSVTRSTRRNSAASRRVSHSTAPHLPYHDTCTAYQAERRLLALKEETMQRCRACSHGYGPDVWSRALKSASELVFAQLAHGWLLAWSAVGSTARGAARPGPGMRGVPQPSHARPLVILAIRGPAYAFSSMMGMVSLAALCSLFFM